MRGGSIGEGHSSIGNQLSTVTVQSESGSVQGINNEESMGESHKEQVSNMVGWIVYKKYGMHEVKGVVESYNPETKIYDVRYRDGKSEKVIEDNLVRYLSPCKPENEQPRAKSLRINVQNSGHIRKARKVTKRTRAGARTAPAQQSKQVSGGATTSEVPTSNSGNQVKERYKSLRMNAGR